MDGFIYDNEISRLFESWPGYVVFISGTCYGAQILDDFRGDKIVVFADGGRHELSDLSFFSSTMKYDVLGKYTWYLKNVGGHESDTWLNFFNMLAKKRQSSFLNDDGDVTITKGPWVANSGADGYLAANLLLYCQEKVIPFPNKLFLLQNYPNPFNPTTTITFKLPETNRVVLRVYNTLGQEVFSLVNGVVEAGVYSVTWKAKDASGVYFARLQVGDFVQTIRMQLLK